MISFAVQKLYNFLQFPVSSLRITYYAVQVLLGKVLPLVHLEVFPLLSLLQFQSVRPLIHLEWVLCFPFTLWHIFPAPLIEKAVSHLHVYFWHLGQRLGSYNYVFISESSSLFLMIFTSVCAGTKLFYEVFSIYVCQELSHIVLDFIVHLSGFGFKVILASWEELAVVPARFYFTKRSEDHWH